MKQEELTRMRDTLARVWSNIYNEPYDPDAWFVASSVVRGELHPDCGAAADAPVRETSTCRRSDD